MCEFQSEIFPLLFNVAGGSSKTDNEFNYSEQIDVSHFITVNSFNAIEVDKWSIYFFRSQFAVVSAASWKLLSNILNTLVLMYL